MDRAPVIDLDGWWSGDRVARRRIAAEFDAACRTTGFLQVVGHRVDERLRAGVRAAADGFFALAEDEKRLVQPPSPALNRGYAPRRSESLGTTLGTPRPADLVEAFVVGNDHADDPRFVPDDPYYEAERERAFAPNLWPARPAGFREAVWAYFGAVAALSHTLTDVAALALGLEEGWFRPRIDRAVETLRLNWYERRPGESELAPDQMGLGAHTDYGILTVLLADPGPGLAVVGPDGAWHDLEPIAEGFVVNLGDAMAVWTNDVWASTIHRVAPPAGPGGPPRRSFAFFQDGNHDAVLTCLPTCTSADRPPRYAPIGLGAHVMGKILAGRAGAGTTGTVQTHGGRAQDVR